jgi:hypothetical protein
MPFKKGDKKPENSGRKKGVPNKRRTIFEELEEIQTEDGQPVSLVKLFFRALETMPPYQQVDSLIDFMKFVFPQQKQLEIGNKDESGFKIVIEDYTKK